MTLKEIAERLLFAGLHEGDMLIHWEYRKGKGREDIKKAVRKALHPKNGRAKVEFELSMLETYLRDILKKRKTPLKQVVGAVIYDPAKGYLCGYRVDKFEGWEFVGGKVEKGETPQQALKREVWEEIGCEAEIEEMVDCSIINNVLLFKTFKTRLVSGEPEARVHTQLRWFKKEELEGLNWLEADIPTIQRLLRG